MKKHLTAFILTIVFVASPLLGLTLHSNTTFRNSPDNIYPATLIHNSAIVIDSAKTPEFIKRLKIQRITGKIEIDGILNEEIWKSPGITAFFQQDPNQGKPASEKTEVWMAYDDDAIYIAAKLYDSHPDSILSNLSRRDYSTVADAFVVYLDPFYDKRTGFYFGITASGVLKDGILYNDSWSDSSWDGVWEGTAKIDADGWALEMRIPFSQLRFVQQTGYAWGINFSRYICRKEETSYLVYTPRNKSGFVSRFPGLDGLEKINPPQRFSILPYVTGKAEYLQHSPGDPFNSGSKYTPGIGVDFKYGIGTNLTLDATINPDFGQVEVDPAVVNLSDNETSYSENRPFFIEGTNIFSFGNGGANRGSYFGFNSPSLFYSRRIGRAPQGSLPDNDYADFPTGTHILGAGKITGRILDDWKFGTVQALTKREYADIQLNGAKSETEIEPLTYYGIARAQKDFNSGMQGLGLITTYTHRFFSDERLRSEINSDALVSGIDGWTFLDKDKEYVLTGWFVLSNVYGNKERIIQLQQSSMHYFQRPDGSVKVDSNATSMTGYAGRLFLNKQSGTWWMNASFGVISPKFNTNDLGIFYRGDMINWHLQYVKTWNTPTDLYRNMGIGNCIYQTFDYAGNTTTAGNYLWSYITFSNYYEIDLSFDYEPEYYNNRKTRGGPQTLEPLSRNWNLSASSNTNKPVSVSLYYNLGSSVGRYDNIGASLILQPSTNLSIQIGPSLYKTNEPAQWVGSYNDPSATQTYGRRYVFAKLNQTEVSANIRFDWVLSPTLSFQVYIQPLISTGQYTNMKMLAKSRSYDFSSYGENGSTVNKKFYADGSFTYELDVDGSGTSPVYTVENPDFNVISLRGNAVLRWEYMPGSTLYFVWTQSRYSYNQNGEFEFNRSFSNLSSIRPDNIFMVKLTYWLGK
jgi:hypothetical protein